MLRIPVLSCLTDVSLCARKGGRLTSLRSGLGGVLILLFLFLGSPARAVILWADTDATLVHENGSGADILGGAVKRDDSANDSLYFKFHVAPLSDKDTEDYFAGFELYEGDQ